MVKNIFGLDLMSQKKSDCEKIDVMRLKKYMGYMIGKSKLLPYDKFKQAGNVPVEHLFRCHNGVTRHGAMRRKSITLGVSFTLQ